MGATPHGLPYPEDTDPVMQGAQAMKALAAATDSLWALNGRPGALDVYAALNAIGAGATTWPGYPIAYTCDPETATGDLGPAGGNIRGAVFVPRESRPSTGVGVLFTVASSGALSGYLGANLFQYMPDKSLKYLCDTGATKPAGQSNVAQWARWRWRDAGDTADTPFQLVAGVPYVVTVTFATYVTTMPRIGAWVPSAPVAQQVNFHQPDGYLRSILVTGQTTRRTSDIPGNGYASGGSLPLLAVYG